MKIIIFDDDPTGSQTVYGCPLLLKWDKETLTKGIINTSPLLFLLTNTRSLSPERAEIRIREICKNLKGVMKEIGLKKEEIIYVSRGDWTLRGHAVLEPEIINDELGVTIASASSMEKSIRSEKQTRKELAERIGKEIAKRSIDNGIKDVAFDKGRYKYHGVIKILAEAARQEGLNF